VITPDIPVRRFANACWWLLRALTHDGIVEALVDSARELTGADAAFFAGRDGDDLRITAASGLSNPDLARGRSSRSSTSTSATPTPASCSSSRCGSTRRYVRPGRRDGRRDCGIL
jgi:hypothetical protein